MAAYRMTGRTINTPAKDLEESMALGLAGSNPMDWKKVDPVDLSSRITKDILFNVSVGVRGVFITSTAGYGYGIGNGDFGNLVKINPADTVGDMSFGLPNRSEYQATIKSAEIVGAAPEKCTVKNDWFLASREVAQTDEGIVIREVHETRQEWIKNEEIQASEFKEIQAELTKCFPKMTVIFKLKKPALAH
jgi:hypothetical protein